MSYYDDAFDPFGIQPSVAAPPAPPNHRTRWLIVATAVLAALLFGATLVTVGGVVSYRHLTADHKPNLNSALEKSLAEDKRILDYAHKQGMAGNRSLELVATTCQSFHAGQTVGDWVLHVLRTAPTTEERNMIASVVGYGTSIKCPDVAKKITAYAP